jgi:hypothetical protein
MQFPLELACILGEAALEMAQAQAKSFRRELDRRQRPGAGGTLRPGRGTPLWNQLRVQLKPHLRKYGSQVHLARLLGLPRQRINSFVTGGAEMPDAERTLQLLAWLMMVQAGKAPE